MCSHWLTHIFSGLILVYRATFTLYCASFLTISLEGTIETTHYYYYYTSQLWLITDRNTKHCFSIQWWPPFSFPLNKLSCLISSNQIQVSKLSGLFPVFEPNLWWTAALDQKSKTRMFFFCWKTGKSSFLKEWAIFWIGIV